MKEKKTETVIGYGGFDLLEECYGYNENACYIADSKASADRFMRKATFGGEYRVEPVTISRVMDDFGYSLGEFAMEKLAFERFRAAADAAGIRFQAGPVDFSPELTLVNVDGVKRHLD